MRFDEAMTTANELEVAPLYWPNARGSEAREIRDEKNSFIARKLKKSSHGEETLRVAIRH